MLKADVDRLIEEFLKYIDTGFEVRISFYDKRSEDEIYSISVHIYDYKYFWTETSGNALILTLMYEKDDDEHYKTIVFEGDTITIGDKKIRLPNIKIKVGHSYEDGLTIKFVQKEKD